MKIRFQSILVITLLFPGVLTQMQAVSPTPDGCYPNFTTAEGCDALSSLTTGAGNTALGWRSLFLDSTGSFNTAVGGGALVLNTADDNTAVGAAALLLNTTGSDNTAVGTDALVFNDSGGGNIAIGSFALYHNTDGAGNTAIGAGALSQNTIGSTNIAVGSSAGSQVTGDDNIDVGNPGVAAESHTIRIGEFSHTATYIAGISGQAAVGGDAVLITDDGKLGTVNFSSERFKEEIKPMDKASETILALNPVTFRYKSEIDPKGIPRFGLVAEEVDKVNPDLVKRDAKGEIYTVRYDAVNAMLLNEFLKEHRAFIEEQRKVANQQKEIEALKVELKEQRSIIENVSARLEASQPATKVAIHEP